MHISRGTPVPRRSFMQRYTSWCFHNYSELDQTPWQGNKNIAMNDDPIVSSTQLRNQNCDALLANPPQNNKTGILSGIHKHGGLG